MACHNKLGIWGRESEVELELQNTYAKVWMAVEVGYKWMVSLVEVSAEETQHRISGTLQMYEIKPGGENTKRNLGKQK